jgi:hypothetical protein
MIIELRRYSILPGRIADMHTRMREVLLPMFAEHGIPRPFAIWDSVEPDGSSMLSWMLNWESYERRNAAWATFKPLFGKVRQARGGDEFVSCTDLTLIEAWPSLELRFPSGDIACEAAWHVQPRIGHQPGFRDACNNKVFGLFQELGASSVTACDPAFGALPQSIVYTSWPSQAKRDHGLQHIASAAFAQDLKAAIGGSEFRAASVWQSLDRAPYLGGW